MDEDLPRLWGVGVDNTTTERELLAVVCIDSRDDMSFGERKHNHLLDVKRFKILNFMFKLVLLDKKEPRILPKLFPGYPCAQEISFESQVVNVKILKLF